MDAGLKWTIKNKAKHIAELSTVDAFMARLVKIKDAVINEKNEDAAVFHSPSAACDDGDMAAVSADEDDVIKVANPTKYPENGLKYWQAFAAQTLKTYVKLVVEASTEAALATVMEGSEANKSKGQVHKSAVLIFLDPDLLAEAWTRPAERKPLLPEGILARLLRGSMRGRGCQASVSNEYVLPLEGDIYVLTDGKRDYLHRPFMDAFTPKGRKPNTEAIVRRFTHYASEESLRARKTLVRGSDSLPQQGAMFCISKTTIVGDIIPERRHIMYNGSSRGDIIGPIVLPTLAAQWQLSFAKKKELYGDRLLSGDSRDTDPRSIRKDDVLEPVFSTISRSSFTRT